MSIISRIQNYICNTIFPWERAWSTLTAEKNTVKVGWCSVYPPIPNGVAVMTGKIVKEFLKKQQSKKNNVEIYAIPEIGKIDKKKFSGIRFAKPNDMLDVIFFFSAHNQIKRYNPHTKLIAWQTLHYYFKEKDSERELFQKIAIADGIIVPTKMAQKEYSSHTTKKINYIPEGIDIDKYQFTPHKKKKVFFNSRSMYYKGIVPFLDAVPLIIYKHPDVEIIAHLPLDKNSPYLQEIIAAIRQRKQEFPNNFYYTMAWSSEYDIQTQYHDSAVLIFPSNNEGFGIPLIEAMASGTICIVADRPPMNELVENTITGICLPLKKQKKYHNLAFPLPRSIAKACNDVLSNPEKWRIIQKNARKKVEQEYNSKKTAEALLQYALNLVEKSEKRQETL